MKGKDFLVPQKYGRTIWKFNTQACIDATKAVDEALKVAWTNIPTGQLKSGREERIARIQNKQLELTPEDWVRSMFEGEAITRAVIRHRNSVLNDADCTTIKQDAEALKAKIAVQFAGTSGAIEIDMSIIQLHQL